LLDQKQIFNYDVGMKDVLKIRIFFLILIFLPFYVFSQELEPIITEPSQIIQFFNNIIEYAAILLDSIFAFISNIISSFFQHFIS